MAFLKVLALCLALMSLSEAREFHVVDDNASWQIPSLPHLFDKWAQRNRFQIGDTIFLKYDAKADSVLEVSEADYNTCSRSNPIKTHNDGNTRITLDKPGGFFFISGADGHCEKGQKLQMRVLSPNHHNHNHHHHAPAPAPSPLDDNHNHHAPAPAPAHHNAAAMLRAALVLAAALPLSLALLL